ncbi:MAG TPA: site-specific DNA-methyltransferase [Candidatus Nitrosotenuis sp.]|nr:site-specific DNA-methyltransferase [Candidatus Nitrosotenuis sp.]
MRAFSVGSSRVVLHQADCLEVLAKMPEGSIDVVVTSPPYNLGVRYNSYDDRISRQDYLDWMALWAARVRRVLAEEGSLFLNLGGKPSDPWGPFEVALRLRGILELQNVIHWIKSIHIKKEDAGDYGLLKGDLTVGHYKPIMGHRYLNDCHEYVFHFTRTGRVKLDRLALGVPYQDKSNIARWRAAGQGLHCRGNTWFVPYKTIRCRDLQRPHPASFPVALAANCLKLHGLRPGLRVLDPFLGIGHAGVAAVECGADFIGVETDPEYFETACAQIARARPRPGADPAPLQEPPGTARPQRFP